MDIYEPVIPTEKSFSSILEKIRKNKYTAFLFTSPSAWKNFSKLLGDDFKEHLYTIINRKEIAVLTQETIAYSGFFVKSFKL